jgi:DNA-3-methyladenine glycosylase I
LEKKRCGWVKNATEIYIRYHDEDWGVPIFDDKMLFELLILEGAQAGLSWLTVLKKRENYRLAFDGFDFEKVALYEEDKVQELLGNSGIIRNKLKVRSAIRNARVFIKIREEFGTFSDYLWGFVDHNPIINRFASMRDIPAKTELSDKISIDLKKRGMNFVGSTIIYAYMQSMGIVNDHEISCFRYKELI